MGTTEIVLLVLGSIAFILSFVIPAKKEKVSKETEKERKAKEVYKQARKKKLCKFFCAMCMVLVFLSLTIINFVNGEIGGGITMLFFASVCVGGSILTAKEYRQLNPKNTFSKAEERKKQKQIRASKRAQEKNARIARRSLRKAKRAEKQHLRITRRTLRQAKKLERKGEIQAARRIYSHLAAEGNAVALFKVFEFEIETPNNYQHAIHSLEMSAAKEYKPAQELLARLYKFVFKKTHANEYELQQSVLRTTRYWRNLKRGAWLNCLICIGFCIFMLLLLLSSTK